MTEQSQKFVRSPPGTNAHVFLNEPRFENYWELLTILLALFSLKQPRVAGSSSSTLTKLLTIPIPSSLILNGPRNWHHWQPRASVLAAPLSEHVQSSFGPALRWACGLEWWQDFLRSIFVVLCFVKTILRHRSVGPTNVLWLAQD